MLCWCSCLLSSAIPFSCRSTLAVTATSSSVFPTFASVYLSRLSSFTLTSFSQCLILHSILQQRLGVRALAKHGLAANRHAE